VSTHRAPKRLAGLAFRPIAQPAPALDDAQRAPARASAGLRLFRTLAFGVALIAVGCAPARRGIELPDGAGVPLSDYAALWERVTAPCRGVRTMEFLLVLGGRSGDQNLRRTRLRAAAERPASLRIEALAPFGAPVFIFVARDDQATLLLPRDRQVVRNARPADVLHALAGLALGPSDVHALLTGCLERSPVATAARRYPDGSVAVELQGGTTAYVRDPGGGQVIVAGRRGGLTVEYSEHMRGLPRRFRIRVDGPRGGTDLAASLSRVNMNTVLHPAAFAVEVPAQYVPVTLAGLRGASPLEARTTPAGEAAPRP